MLSKEEIEANPVGTQLLLEDEQVRIWQIVLEPGQEAAFHTHNLDYTTVTVESGQLERLNDDGTVDRVESQAGRVMRWYKSTRTHGLRNVGPTRFSNIIVELKGVPAVFDQGSRSSR